MSDNIITAPPNYGGQINELANGVQGSRHTYTVVWKDLAGNGFSLAGGTLAGYFQDVESLTNYEVSGTLTPDADQVTNPGRFTWTMSAEDVGLSGSFLLQFKVTIGGVDYYTYPVPWEIEQNLNVTPVTPPAVVDIYLRKDGSTPLEGDWEASDGNNRLITLREDANNYVRVGIQDASDGLVVYRDEASSSNILALNTGAGGTAVSGASLASDGKGVEGLAAAAGGVGVKATATGAATTAFEVAGGVVNGGGQRYADMGDATADTDGLNRQTGDGRYALAAHAANHTDGTDDIQDATAGQKGLMTAAYASKVDGVEVGATADQSDAEIETAYNNQVGQVSAGEKTVGTETAVRRFSPKDVADMAGTHGGGGGDMDSATYDPGGVSEQLVGLTAAQTLTNKTLTLPTIGDLTNATHDHEDAAGGGSLDAAAVGSGEFPTARIADNAITNVKMADDSVGVAELSATGTPSAFVFLRGDNTWATPAVGGDMYAVTYDPAGVGEQLVGLTAAQTLANKTLTTPTIGDMSNATHNHQNAAGGGALDAAALGSGTLADGRVAESNVTQHQAALSITESQISDLDHTDGDAIHDDVAGEIAALTEKASPVSGDLLIIEDSAASNAKKKVQVGNLPGGGGSDNIFAARDDTGGITILSSPTFKDVEWTVEDRKDSAYSHSTSASEEDITLVDAGDYVIHVDVSVDITSGSARTVLEGKLQLKPSGGSFGDVAGSLFYLYARDSATPRASASAVFFVTASANDVIKVSLTKLYGSNACDTLADGSRIFIRKLP
jgi:hypothetical protein